MVEIDKTASISVPSPSKSPPPSLKIPLSGTHRDPVIMYLHARHVSHALRAKYDDVLEVSQLRTIDSPRSTDITYVEIRDTSRSLLRTKRTRVHWNQETNQHCVSVLKNAEYSQAGARQTRTSLTTTLGGESSFSWNWQNTSPSFSVPVSSAMPTRQLPLVVKRLTTSAEVHTDQVYSVRKLDPCSPFQILQSSTFNDGSNV